jgi:site-specific recombinase XerD
MVMDSIPARGACKYEAISYKIQKLENNNLILWRSRQKKENDVMETAIKDQRTIQVINEDYYLSIWQEAFLIDRKAQGLSKGTIEFYKCKLAIFNKYCEGQLIQKIPEITPESIRRFLLWLNETGHNPGGIHACYRTLKVFFKWWEKEIEPEGWSNPIKKVKAPKVGIEPLEPISIDVLNALTNMCIRGSFYGERDRAILYVLLDTGTRASEFLNIQLDDLELISGSILIRKGKGNKPRIVFIGNKSRKAVRSYLRQRRDKSNYLWVSRYGEKLSYGGLRGLLRRRAKIIGIKQPSIHSFRRAFALQMLRNGVDVFSIQRLMGHADLQVLRRYLLQTEGDLSQAFIVGSPVDKIYT